MSYFPTVYTEHMQGIRLEVWKSRAPMEPGYCCDLFRGESFLQFASVTERSDSIEEARKKGRALAKKYLQEESPQ